MSSNSWRKYGGKSIVLNDTINVGTVVANQFLTRTTSAITSTFDNVNILGEAIIHHNAYLDKDVYISGNEYLSQNLFLKEKLMFGIDFSNNLNPYTYIAGNQNFIGINTLSPSTILQITGNASDILTVSSNTPSIRNIIGENIDKAGIVVYAEDLYSRIEFYNDTTTAAKNYPNAYLQYNQGGILSLSTTAEIDLTAERINVNFGTGLLHLEDTNSVMYSPGNLLLNTKNIFMNATNTFLFAYSPNETISSGILLNDFGITFDTTQSISLVTGEKIILGGSVIDISSTVVMTTLGLYEPLYNATLTVYDSSNAVFLYNVYQDASAYSGTSITAAAMDEYSTTQIKLVTPGGAGAAFFGGAFPHINSDGTIVPMASLMLVDTCGNEIPGFISIYGKNPLINSTSFGLNTYFPDNNYVLDVNGRAHIGNGQVTVTTAPNFEILFTKFSAINTGSGIAVGTSVPNYATDPVEYIQTILYTRDGGATWTPSNIGGELGLVYDVSNAFTSLYVYDQSLAVVGTTSSYMFYTLDGGVNWNALIYDGANNPIDDRTTESALIIPRGPGTYNAQKETYTNVYTFYSVVTYTDPSNVNWNEYNYPYLSSYTFTATYDPNNMMDVILPSNIGSSLAPYIINNSDTDGSYAVYLVGNGIIQFLISNNQFSFNSFNTLYYNIYTYDANYSIAVGYNIISWTTNGSSLDGNREIATVWNHSIPKINSNNEIPYNAYDPHGTTVPTYNPTPIKLKSVYIYDLSYAVAVGDGGIFIYSTEWTTGNWAVVPDALLNSSGVANLISSSPLLQDVHMLDINTFVVTVAKPPSGASNSGSSEILYCYFPNLFNRAENNVLEVSGNMIISGNISINDAGQINSNNATFNILTNPEVQQINVGTTGTSVNIAGGAIAAFVPDACGNITDSTGHSFVGTNGHGIYNKDGLLLDTSGGNLITIGSSGDTIVISGTNVIISGNAGITGNTVIQGNADLQGKGPTNVFQRDASLSSTTFQQITTNMGVSGDISLNGRVYASTSLYVNTGGIESPYYALDVSGTTNLEGTVMPMTLVDNSVLLTNTPAFDFSNNFCTNWTLNLTAPETYDWTCIAMSANGMFQTAMGNSTGIWISSNYGVNWRAANISSQLSWTSVAMTAEGNTQVAATGEYIYISRDYGNTWAKLNPVPFTTNLYSVAISSNGQFISAVGYAVNKANIYYSTNGGTSFTTNTLSGNLSLVTLLQGVNTASIAMSSTGEYQVCCLNSNNVNSANAATLWTSSTYGQYWKPVTLPYKNFNTVCMSSSGKYIYIGCSIVTGQSQSQQQIQPPNLFVSKNNGASFSSVGAAISVGLDIVSVSISEDGKYITAASGIPQDPEPPQMITSVNYGVTWTLASTSPLVSWQAVCMSANAQFLSAVTKQSNDNGNGSIYTSLTPYIYMSIANTLTVGGPVFQF